MHASRSKAHFKKLLNKGWVHICPPAHELLTDGGLSPTTRQVQPCVNHLPGYPVNLRLSRPDTPLATDG